MIRLIFNQKGGVGKTSLVCNLAAQASKFEKKVLVIDLDPQANASWYLGAPEDVPTLADFFEQSISFHIHRKGLDAFAYPSKVSGLEIAPAHAELKNLEPRLATRHKIYVLKQAIESLQQEYDEIYIDTAPDYNLYTVSALVAADACLIPVDCDSFAVNALEHMLALFYEIRDDHNPELELEGVILNQYQARTKSAQQIRDKLEQMQIRTLPVSLHSSVKMKESHAAQLPLPYFAPNHKLSQEIAELYQNLNPALVIE